MAFSTARGRPRKPIDGNDLGTPELRLKHALRLTSEPIDLCLEKNLITPEQHWCGLHLRWLYTLRYGAPSLTTHYTDRESPASPPTGEDATWRQMRELEYRKAIHLLKENRRYECIMRLTVFNESPSFLNSTLRAQAFSRPQLAHALARLHADIREGLELLTIHWDRRHPSNNGTVMQQ